MAVSNAGPNSYPFLRAAAQTAVAVGGLFKYLVTGRSSCAARLALLDLHCGTNGKSTGRLAPLIQAIRPPRRPAAVSGTLGNFSVVDQDEAVKSIARDGFYIFERKISAAICDEIQKFAAHTPALTVNEIDPDSAQLAVFDPVNPISKIYRLRERDSITNPAIQRLMADPVFLGIAERYMGILPIFSEVGMWWSPALATASAQDAAQEYHFDFNSPPVWLKLFIYLTDVGPENGPHMFVRGSHASGNAASATLLREGYVRIPDKKIISSFGAENVVSIQGMRGTVFFADTRGFHKGKPPTRGHRLLLEFLYASPQFNDFNEGGVPRRYALPPQVDPALSTAMAKAPRIYERYQ